MNLFRYRTQSMQRAMDRVDEAEQRRQADEARRRKVTSEIAMRRQQRAMDDLDRRLPAPSPMIRRNPLENVMDATRRMPMRPMPYEEPMYPTRPMPGDVQTAQSQRAMLGRDETGRLMRPQAGDASGLSDHLRLAMTPLVPEQYSRPASRFIGQGVSRVAEQGGVTPLTPLKMIVSELAERAGVSPAVDVGGYRFRPLSRGLVPEEVRTDTEEAFERNLPYMTSPVGIAAAGAFPAATAVGTAGAITGSVAGRQLERQGVDPIDTPIGRIGPRSLFEFGGGFVGPGRSAVPRGAQIAQEGVERVGRYADETIRALPDSSGASAIAGLDTFGKGPLMQDVGVRAARGESGLWQRVPREALEEYPELRRIKVERAPGTAQGYAPPVDDFGDYVDEAPREVVDDIERRRVMLPGPDETTPKVDYSGEMRAPRASDEGVEIWHDRMPPTTRIQRELRSAENTVQRLEAQIEATRGRRGVNELRGKLNQAKRDLGRWRTWADIDAIRRSDVPVEEQIEKIRQEADYAYETMRDLEGLRQQGQAAQETYGMARSLKIQQAIRSRFDVVPGSEQGSAAANRNKSARYHQAKQSLERTEYEDLGRHDVLSQFNDDVKIMPSDEVPVRVGSVDDAPSYNWQAQQERTAERSGTTSGLIDRDLSRQYPEKLPRQNVRRRLEPQERDAVGEALDRLDRVPGEVEPVGEAITRLPRLQQYVEQVNVTKDLHIQAKARLVAARKAVKDGVLAPSRVPEAQAVAAQAKKEADKATQALKGAYIRALREDVVDRVAQSTEDPAIARIIGAAFDDSVQMIPNTEPLLTAPSWRQRFARAAAAVQGTPPGQVGRIADQAEILRGTLARQSEEVVRPVFDRVQKLLNKEQANLRYIGPAKWREVATGDTMQLHVVQHPEWYFGMTPELKGAMDEAQTLMRNKLRTAQEMGYPIKELDREYLEQLWETTPNPLESPVPRIAGKVSVAKERVFDDYAQGMRRGFQPKADMTVQDLMDHSAGLLDRAIADAFVRQEVLRRFGSRAARATNSGWREFGHPLYRGWHAPSPITNFVDQLYNPVGPGMRAVQDVASAFKNTAFGVGDFAVAGIQFPLAIAKNGLGVAAGTLNRSLEMAGLPNMSLYADTEAVSRLTQAAQDGLHLGRGPSSVSQGGNTILKYVPKVGKALDWVPSKIADTMSDIQFTHALTAVRLRAYEGNLVTLKALGQNIDDPAVRRTAADWANAATGASRGALTPGRRAVESSLLTSYQMGRAELASYAQIAQGLTGTGAQRIRAAIILANLGATVYGIQYVVNREFGDGPMEWVPGKSNWATIDVSGRRYKILPSTSILRAVEKSVEALAPGGVYGVEDLPRIWTQLAVGKANPLVQVPLSAAGFGYEPGTGQFKTGDLSPEGRAMGMIPQPPLAEQIISNPEARSPEAIGTGVAGLSGYNVPPIEWLNRKARESGAESWFDLQPTVKMELEADPEVAAKVEEYEQDRRERGSQSQLRSDELEEKSAPLTEEIMGLSERALASGDPDDIAGALAEIATKRAELRGVRQGIYGDGQDYESRGEVEAAVDRWYDAYDTVERDPVTGKIADYDELDRLQQGALKGLSAGNRAAVQAYMSRNLSPLEVQRNQAREVLDAAPSKYAGMAPERSFEVDEFMQEVGQKVDELEKLRTPQFPRGLDIRPGTVARYLAEQRGDNALFTQYAQIVSDKASGDFKPSAEYSRWLTENRAQLEPFYDWLYSSKWEQLAAGDIGPESFETSGRAPRVRRTVGKPRISRREREMQEERLAWEMGKIEAALGR